MRNQGFELELNWNDKISDFEYNVGFNISTIANKVVALANEDQTIYGVGLKYGSEHFPTQTKVGKPIGAFYLYQADGIFQIWMRFRLTRTARANSSAKCSAW